ncbi:MAG: hypothetical protein QOE70_379 [Chthoniobacter sp.]|jgi:hypothetical protein|nr:hypothetical protein [Chthoniobacter sp.]
MDCPLALNTHRKNNPMIPSHASSILRVFLGTLAAVLLGTFATAHDATQPGEWFIALYPSDGGSVMWNTTNPVASGTLTDSGTITFSTTGSDIGMQIKPNPGFQLQAVYTVHYNFTPYLTPPNNSITFTPNPPTALVPTLYVVFERKTPTGSFAFTFPTSKPGVIPVVDMTGNYQGNTPTMNHRPYNVAVAMDDEGKVDSEGTIQGVATSGGSTQLAALVGSVKTKNGEPIGQGKGKFEGTLDGVAAQGSASGSGPVKFDVLNDSVGGRSVAGGSAPTVAVAGTGSYDAKVGIMAFKDKNMPVSVPVSQGGEGNIKKAWSLQLDISKKTNATTGKPYIAASSILTLPNGDKIAFAEKVVKFSVKDGYSLKFTKGTNTTRDPDVLDKKTTVQLSKMHLEEQSGVWKPIDGAIDYSFLGQKGKASVADFVP